MPVAEPAIPGCSRLATSVWPNFWKTDRCCSALVIDTPALTSTAALPAINISNATLDTNSDGISDYDNLVIESSVITGTGIGIRINLSNLSGLNHITIDNVSVTGNNTAVSARSSARNRYRP